jgi:hypothetical protein
MAGSRLECEGIVGDGCGGGRIFRVEDGELLAYDPMTQEAISLLKGIQKANKIFKKGCIITIECEDQTIKFDLSKINKK